MTTLEGDNLVTVSVGPNNTKVIRKYEITKDGVVLVCFIYISIHIIIGNIFWIFRYEIFKKKSRKILFKKILIIRKLIKLKIRS